MQTILFLDIDGVFSIQDPSIPMQQVGGVHCWPVPMANDLLRAIDADPRLHPIWLSSWDTGGHIWNKRAGTRQWPIGYHLDDKAAARARGMFPHLHSTKADKKLIAVWYHLYPFENSAEVPVVWIEDGFAKETHQWAEQRENVRLIDATDPAIRDMLVQRYPDTIEAARAFVDEYVIAKVSV